MAERREGDEDYLATARIVGLYTLTGLIAFTILVDAIGRLVINPEYHTDASIFIPLVGAWTGLMGLETASILRRRMNGHTKDKEDADQ